MYEDVPSWHLIFVTHADHWKRHGNFSTERYENITKGTIEAMKNVPYETLAYWKGKTNSKELTEKKRALICERRDAYNLYKNQNGKLKWNDWQRDVWTKYAELKDRTKHSEVEDDKK